MAWRCFEVVDDGPVAHLRLCRPDELNTMVPEFWRELPQIVTGLSDAGRARALVISSTGRHFSAGMDLSVFAALGGGADGSSELEAGRRHNRLREQVEVLQAALGSVAAARMPVLAAVQGGCLGGALDLVTACDLRYASADAFFCVQETNLGMVADCGTLARLGRLVGDGVARELALTGRRMDAARAFQAGLVAEVFPDHDALVAGALAVAGEIAARSPLAVHGTKAALDYARDHPVPDALAQVAVWQAGMFQPADPLEALAARGERREPKFPDLPPRANGL